MENGKWKMENEGCCPSVCHSGKEEYTLKYTINSIFHFICAAVMLLYPLPIAAQNFAAGNQVEITADGSLEWHAKDNLYLARKNARAVSGDTVISADLLTARKRASGKNKKQNDNFSGDIDRMTAEGNVVINLGDVRIFGDFAENDVDNAVFIIKGTNLKYESAQDTVTARDSMEYWKDKKTAIAKGNATVFSKDRKIIGDILTAVFRAQPNGKDQLHKAVIDGNVTVITRDDVVRGDKAVYDIGRNLAIITGNVKITRKDGTELAGDMAESDFANGISRLVNEGGGKVKALISSGDAKTKKDAKSNGKTEKSN
ncbi:MAG: hypothetical protein FWF23_05035 [Alphaproteobacteria bacterium]|nr:hypothetical protein [Alphaproteobacteria bacterium]MCL2504635.1 hypothetical protein [Alphaproteobacteria bacterium]